MVETITPAGAYPPPPPPPPPYYRPPQGHGCGFWAGWILAIIFFLAAGFFLFTTVVVSVAKIGSLATKSTTAGAGLTEKSVEGSGSDKILLLPVHGIIGEREADSVFSTPESTVQYVHQRLENARTDSAVKAVILDVDSPGGGITASDVICHEIQNFKKDGGRKVVVCMGDLAASGGYYISTPADWIVAHPTTITGSIGVIMLNFDASLLLTKIGVQDASVKSGPLKDIGSWTRPMTPDEKAILDKIIAEMLGQFIQVIADGRKLPKDKVRELADGRIFTASQAKAAKLVDDIGYFPDALKKAKELAKITGNAKLIRYDKSFSFSSFFEAETETLHRGPGLDAALHDLAFPQGPRLMYLWTGR